QSLRWENHAALPITPGLTSLLFLAAGAGAVGEFMPSLPFPEPLQFLNPKAPAEAATERGAVAGGLIGGGLGALAGKAVGQPIASTPTGGSANPAVDTSTMPAESERRPPLTLPDIVELTRKHIHPEMIIRQVEITGSYYNMSADDLVYLRGNGVSDAVITVM